MVSLAKPVSVYVNLLAGLLSIFSFSVLHTEQLQQILVITYELVRQTTNTKQTTTNYFGKEKRKKQGRKNRRERESLTQYQYNYHFFHDYNARSQDFLSITTTYALRVYNSSPQNFLR